jgi:succinoglycan biosynthesis transport protein ExoP
MTTLPQTTGIQLPRPVASGALSTQHAPASLAPVAMQMNGADVWRVIRTNLWLIVASVVVAAVFGFAINWYLTAFYARYTATGYVQIEPGTPFDPTGRGGAALAMVDPNSSLVVEQKTQTQMLKTDYLFTQVLQNPNGAIRSTQWFNEFKKSDGSFDIAKAKEDLYAKFSATPYPDTKLISVSFTYRIPKDCSVIVNDIVNQHIENERKRNADKSLDRTQSLNNLRVRYENVINSLKNETALKAAQLQVDEMGRPGGVSQKENEMAQLLTSRLKAESEAAGAQQALEAAKAQLDQGATPSSVEAMVNQNPKVSRLSQLIDDYDIRLRAMLNAGREARDFKQTQADRDATQQKLDEVRAEERANDTVLYMDELSNKATAAQHDLDGINKQVDKIKNDLADMASTLSDYISKKDEEQSYVEMVRNVRDKLDVLTNNQTSRELNTIDWGPRPEVPDTPSFPQLPITLAVSVAIGLFLSLGVSFVRELLDTTVRSPRDIARVGQMTLLGMIPHEDDDPQSAGVPLPTVIYGAPTSMMAEQFRQVRTRLQHAASLDTTRSILVTSPGPGDGKSVIACNLAAGLALNGRRILLVDANFRRPELHKIFDLPNEAGLGSVLNSIENFESTIRQTKVPNLDVMTTGPKPANATELLESQLLIDFIERALEEYDHIIFDSGPMLFVSETVALAPRVDGVVTVVRARSNSRGLLQRLRDALRQLKAEHLGVVLNGVRATGGGYYGRNIKTYYEYQNGPAAE